MSNRTYNGNSKHAAKIFLTFVALVFLLSCGRLERKAKQLRDKAVEIAVEVVVIGPITDSFSIRTIVKDFQGDSSIKEIKGVQAEGLLYIEYCVYKGNRKRVLDGVNKIVPIKVNDYSSDSVCRLTTEEDFRRNVLLPQEKNKDTEFFWRLQQLKNYEVYTCTKAPLLHYIIFDKQSDTVYHRIVEIRD